MRWDIEDKVGRIDLWFFTGINFGGMKKIVRVHPYGGLQGADVDGSEIKSMGVIAEPGVRVILRTSSTALGWDALPWRCIQVLEGFTGRLSDGRTCVQIPDLDLFNPPTARRTDPEIEEVYPHAEGLHDGVGWTFGRTGRKGLKCNLKSIRIERIPDPNEVAEDAEEQDDAAPTPPAPAPEAASVPRPDTPAADSSTPLKKPKSKEPEATIPVSGPGPGSGVKG